jgi:hypothetical protein
MFDLSLAKSGVTLLEGKCNFLCQNSPDEFLEAMDDTMENIRGEMKDRFSRMEGQLREDAGRYQGRGDQFAGFLDENVRELQFYIKDQVFRIFRFSKRSLSKYKPSEEPKELAVEKKRETKKFANFFVFSKNSSFSYRDKRAFCEACLRGKYLKHSKSASTRFFTKPTTATKPSVTSCPTAT